VECWSTKAAISLKRVKIDEKLLWRANRNSPMLFHTLPSRPPTASHSPRLWVRNPNPKLQSLLSQEWIKLRASNSAGIFTRYIVHPNKRGRGPIQGLSKFLEYPLLSQEWVSYELQILRARLQDRLDH